MTKPKSKPPVYAMTAEQIRFEAEAREALALYYAKERSPEMGAALVAARLLFDRVSITFYDELFDKDDRFRVLAAALYTAGRSAVDEAERDRDQATRAQVRGLVDHFKRELDRFAEKV